MRTIIIEQYDPTWPAEFEKIRNILYPYISDLIMDIRHVGSTSVPGLSAKPIIDFNIIIESYEIFPKLLERLEVLGYKHDGDGGIAGRERMKNGIRDGFIDYHMYVCPKDSKEHLRQTAFREYLKKYPNEAKEYGTLKIHLAKQFPHDIDSYVAGKHDFVERIVDIAKKEGLYGKY